MAMQKSEELKETTLVLFQQFKALGATTAKYPFAFLMKKQKWVRCSVTLKGEKIDRSFPMEIGEGKFRDEKSQKSFFEQAKKFLYNDQRKRITEL